MVLLQQRNKPMSMHALNLLQTKYCICFAHLLSRLF